MDGKAVPQSPGWVRPSDVMKARKIRAKRHALQARMSCTAKPLMVRSQPRSYIAAAAKRNPFRRSPLKSSAANNVLNNSELSKDATLFNLLHNPAVAAAAAAAAASSATNAAAPQHFTFSQALRHHGIASTTESQPPQIQWMETLPLDWSLKTRIRLIAENPLPWKQNFKTSEEASGTTGMARCLWSGSNSSELDTSPNAEFYQRCLVWQHPSLPGVSLFPRDGSRTLATPNMMSGSSSNSRSASTTGPYASTQLTASLHSAWCDSLRSLHQLIRVRQCAYFYVCAPTFTVVYRAAGVCGIPHAHAMVTPTTRGLRNALREEGIDFKMPFYKQQASENSNSCNSNSSISRSPKLGNAGDASSNNSGCGDVNTSFDDDDPKHSKDEDGDDDLLDDRDATSFLANLGVDTSQFANLNPNRVKQSSREVDRSPLSLVLINDPDTQGLTNFLLNSPSCVQATGPLAGVPPTLLAPVAFQGGTLLPHKVKSSHVRVNGSPQYSMEVTGPILPHTPLQLTSLLTNHLQEFTLHATPLTHTLPFSNCTRDVCANPMTKAFAEEGLVDCGLEDSVRSLVCQPLREARQQQRGDEEKTGVAPLPPAYKQVTYRDNKYTWTDQHATS